MSDITPLLPWLHEPYRKEAVLEAARRLQQPFILGEIAKASGLNRHIVHRVLGRLVHQGVLERFKVRASFPAVTGGRTGGRGGKVRFIPGGRQLSVWAYRFPEGGE